MALINCRECGAQISDAATTCPHCGAPQKPASSGPAIDPDSIGYAGKEYDKFQPCPRTYLVAAILVTIFCCWPLGIPAIVNAVGVNSAYTSGNYKLSLERSAKAKKWCWISFAAGIVIYVIYYILIFVMPGALASWVLFSGRSSI